MESQLDSIFQIRKFNVLSLNYAKFCLPLQRKSLKLCKLLQKNALKYIKCIIRSFKNQRDSMMKFFFNKEYAKMQKKH